MPMSMFMSVPVSPSTAPVSFAPSAAPVADVSGVSSTSPTNATAVVGVMEVATSALLSDGGSVSVSGSPGSTAFVVMASAGGIVLAALAIRRSRKKSAYEDLKKDVSTVEDDEHSFGGVERSLPCSSASKMAV